MGDLGKIKKIKLFMQFVLLVGDSHLRAIADTLFHAKSVFVHPVICVKRCLRSFFVRKQASYMRPLVVSYAALIMGVHAYLHTSYVHPCIYVYVFV